MHCQHHCRETPVTKCLHGAAAPRRLDDIALHRRKQSQQLVGGSLDHMPLLQHFAQDCDHPVEFGLRDMMTSVHFLHRVAGVAAGTAGEIANLLGQQFLDATRFGVFEAPTEHRIRGDPIDERIGDGRQHRSRRPGDHRGVDARCAGPCRRGTCRIRGIPQEQRRVITTARYVTPVISKSVKA